MNLMNCFYHSRNTAIAKCTKCGKSLCADCIIRINDKPYCRNYQLCSETLELPVNNEFDMKAYERRQMERYAQLDEIFNTLEEIEAITGKDCKQHDDFLDDIPYRLQRKATWHKNRGNHELAVACIRKSLKLSNCNGVSFTKQDYSRLPNMLIELGLFEEAAQEKERLLVTYPEIFEKDYSKIKFLQNVIIQAKKMNTDLIIMQSSGVSCEECAKYQGRVYSISGTDIHFPKLPDFLPFIGSTHRVCNQSFSIFFDDVNSMNDNKGAPVESRAYSNRPYVDNRTEREITNYHNCLIEYDDGIAREFERIEYYKLFHLVPDIAPKSFAAYRRAKKKKTDKYVELLKKAKELGIDIY